MHVYCQRAGTPHAERQSDMRQDGNASTKLKKRAQTRRELFQSICVYKAFITRTLASSMCKILRHTHTGVNAAHAPQEPCPRAHSPEERRTGGGARAQGSGFLGNTTQQGKSRWGPGGGRESARTERNEAGARTGAKHEPRNHSLLMSTRAARRTEKPTTAHARLEGRGGQGTAARCPASPAGPAGPAA